MPLEVMLHVSASLTFPSEHRGFNDLLHFDRLERGQVEMKRVGVRREIYHLPDLRASYDRLLGHLVIKSLAVDV